jgi:hypothetical protein
VIRARDRLRRTAGAVRSPSAAWLVVRMLGWALILPILKVRMPMERLVALMWTDARGDLQHRDPAGERQVARLSRISHLAITAGRRDNCLERSLIAYRHLAARNAGPLLVVGVRAGRQGTEGHVWVTVDGEPVHDQAADVATYQPLTVFGAHGRPQPVG